MSCTEPRDLVHAYLDRELDLEKSLEMEQHFQDCATCSEAHEEGRKLRNVLSEGGLYFRAPADLRTRLRTQTQGPADRASRSRSFAWRTMALGVPLALAAVLALTLIPLLKSPMTDDLVADEIVSGHVRSLMATHLTDVASSDKHTVKPWFEGKLDFSPTVVDLADRGFPLRGGRLDYIGDRSVAALVYQRQKHFINVFVWPSTNEGDLGERRSSRHGFNVIHWNAAEMTYWAVSDLNVSELEEFAGFVRERIASPPG